MFAANATMLHVLRDLIGWFGMQQFEKELERCTQRWRATQSDDCR
jgi:hypothetical protein